jgi:hypothetical protein
MIADGGDDRLKEVLEWEYLVDEAAKEIDEEEMDKTPPPAPPVTSMTVVIIKFKRITSVALKEVAVAVNVAQSRTKRAAFDRIVTSGSGVERVDQNTFKYSRPVAEGKTGDIREVFNPPTWVTLLGEPVMPVDGVDMTTGASFGFYDPTNRENASGVV